MKKCIVSRQKKKRSKVSKPLVNNYVSCVVFDTATTATHSALVPKGKAVDPGPFGPRDPTVFCIPEWYYDNGNNC